MSDESALRRVLPEGEAKHPEISSIEDVITFRLHRLVAIGERGAQDWSKRLFDMSLNEWRLLALVVTRAPARAGDVADLLLMDKSQTSRVIKSVTGKGLVRSMADEIDGRLVVLTPTAKGRKLYGEMLSEVLVRNERVLSVLTHEEVAAFSETLQKLIAHNLDLLEARLGRDLTR